MPKGFTSIESKKEITDTSVLDEKDEWPNKFWCYNPLSIECDCCMWHRVFYPNGGPERNGIYHPVYEYEQILLEHLEKGRFDLAARLLAVYKSTGLGITEFFALWIIWKCLTDPWFFGKTVVIVTGPGIDLGKDIIDRFKKFCDKGDIPYKDHGVTELEINQCPIKTFPANNIDAARGLPRVSVFFGDEAAFFIARKNNDKPVRTVGERYMAKGGAYTIWVSTAGDSIECFFYKIYKDPGDYTKFEFYEEVGMKKDPVTNTSIYDDREIEVARKLPSYPREYQGQWGVNVGDIYNQQAVDAICADDFNVNPSDDSFKRWGFVDAGFGSSNFGITLFQTLNGLPTVIYSKSYNRKSFTEMLTEIKRLAETYHIRTWGSDAANPEVIKDMRDTLMLDVTGFAFNKYGKLMTSNAAETVGKLKVRIHPDCTKLKHQIQTIRYKKSGQPDKNTSNPFDEGDCFQGGLWMNKQGMGYMSISNS